MTESEAPPGKSAQESFLRTLLSLPDIRLRIQWLQSLVDEQPARDLAPVLDAVVFRSEIAEPRAREALLTIALWTCGSPPETGLEALRAEAFEQRLLSLQRVIRRVTSAGSRAGPSEPPVPDYGAGRELTLGERRNLARRSTRAQIDALLRDPHPMVLKELLDNPKMREDDVVRVAARRPQRAELMHVIARSIWLSRHRVQLSILFNPTAPPEISVPLIGLCTRPELKDLQARTEVPPILRVTAAELAERRPPWTEDASGSETPIAN